MARIAGVQIPDDKKIKVSLTYIFGIGSSLSDKILEKAKVDSEKRASKLTNEEINKIRRVIEDEGFVVEGDLRREVNDNIKRLKNIGSYRGIRHGKNLPARGQRTKTNSRTARRSK